MSKIKKEDIIGYAYGEEIKDKLVSYLSEELAKNIDKEILRSMGFEPDRNKRRINSIKKILNLLDK